MTQNPLQQNDGQDAEAKAKAKAKAQQVSDRSIAPPPSRLPSPVSPLPLPAARVPAWRFWLPLVIQSALILTIPVQATYTATTGRTVVLQTAPIDPYNLFRGYYVTLGYEISNQAALGKLPGWEELSSQANEANPSMFGASNEFYVILEAPQNPNTQPPAPWKPVAVRRDRPNDLPANQVALRGTDQNGWITYGLERYYIPEDKRAEINSQISQLQGQSQNRPFVVEVKVGKSGQAIPSSFWLEKKQYQF